jgi:serine/threonine-protein kinase RsbW
MRFADWIKSRLEDLRAMVSDDDQATAGAPSSLHETRNANELDLRFDSNPANVSAVRKCIEQFCQTAGLDIPACEEVGLVLNEALANVIRHAYAGATDRPIHVTVAREKGRGVRIGIRDWGNGVDPSQLPMRPHDPSQPGGVGLICLRELMDELRYDPQPDGGMLLLMARTTTGSLISGDEDGQAGGDGGPEENNDDGGAGDNERDCAPSGFAPPT